MFKKFCLLLLFVFIFFLVVLNLEGIYSYEAIEVDYALSNTDYNEIEERKKLVLSNSKYSSNINCYSDFKSSYFDNLTYNFGLNYKGSCGYVAIAMLLSYYDTYLCDDIIPEQYDINSYGESNNMIIRRNSPGILKDAIVSPIDYKNNGYGFDLSANEYYSFMLSLQNTSLHAKLITLGAQRGYFDYNDDKNPCGTNFIHRYNIINDYLTNVIGYKLDKDYSIESFNGESSLSMSKSVRQFTIEQVVKGNPVLLFISKGSGHVVVAYDYDSSNDKLYCHMGWNASQTHTIIEEQSFSRYKSALVINFKSSHKHSNNYAVSNKTSRVNYYCYHDSNILTYSKSHVHGYSSYYESYSNQKHKAYCECGKYALLAHSINSSTKRTINGHIYGNCKDCNALVDLGKTIVINPSSLNRFYNTLLLNK